MGYFESKIESEIIMLYIRWNLKYPLSYSNLVSTA